MLLTHVRRILGDFSNDDCEIFNEKMLFVCSQLDLHQPLTQFACVATILYHSPA